MFPVEARSVGDDVRLLVDRRGVGHLVEPVPQAAGEVEPDVATQQAGIDGEPGFALPPEHLLVVQRGVNGTVAGGGGQGLGGGTGSGQYSGRHRTAQRDPG